MTDISMKHWAWAQRLLLAQITANGDAAKLVVTEIDDCTHCWQLVACYAIRLAANGWYHVTDNDAIADLLQNGIQNALDRLDEGPS